MTITIDGTTGIASVDGSAGSPSVRGADSNTGVYYTTDTVSISTSGSERLKVHPSGRITTGGITNDTSSFSSIVTTGGASNNGGIQVHYNTGAYGGGSMTTANAAGGGLDFWTYTGDIGSEANFTKQLSIAHGGNVTVIDGDLLIGTSGHGIDFGATSDAGGATSEKLDDYEEGTWTPTMASVSSETITVQKGRYTKVGNMVHIWFDMVWSAASSLTSGRIGGLPYTAVAAQPQGGYGAPQFRDANGISSNFRLYGNSSYFSSNEIQLKQYNSSGNEESASYLSSGRITGQGFYFVNNAY